MWLEQGFPPEGGGIFWKCLETVPGGRGWGVGEDCVRHQGESSEEIKSLLVMVGVLLALSGQGPEAKCSAITGC